jgi:hypothetical protein
MKHRELCENTTMSCTKLVMEIEDNDRLGNGPNIDPIMPRDKLQRFPEITHGAALLHV